MTTQSKVYLVGAGSGDPELLTVKAVRLIQQADVIVYDRLIAKEILALIPSATRRIYVGKQCGQHAMPQEQINQLLAELAQQYLNVVRLKGGDPYIFGRGSEEAQHLARHGIAFEVVPGITAASACSVYSGIPLTHRGLARSVEFITGHFRDDTQLKLNWQRFSDPQLTLVFYMGLNNLPLISEQLISAGRNADTPAAVIENGSTPQQRKLISTLQHLPADSLRENFCSPSLIIVGEVVGLADELDWFGRHVIDTGVKDYASVG
jgi:uroporphyrin-III C-methyltransferase/precorrin-2 dehydrogenase/sirohydrochlorin ferrochelatase/uroporphyrin-III C-methyltransferase